MGRIGVVGADGFVGRLVVAELRRHGHPVTALVRGNLSSGEASRPVDDDVQRVAVDATRVDGTAFADLAVVINTAGPFDRTAESVAAAAIDASVGYVDVAAEADVLRRLHDGLDTPARATGVSLVPGAGLAFAIGDLLAGIAAQDQPVETINVAYAFPPSRLGHGNRWSAGTRGTRARVAGLVCTSRVDGDEVDEPIGSSRRLAWFPRPVGPRHAAVVPGGEAVMVPKRLATVRTVRTYLALPGWQAELLQAGCRAVRRRPDGFVARRLRAGGSVAPDAATRSATRWAVVVEAECPDGLARSWAWGHDPYGTTAAIAVAVAERLGHAYVPTGAVTPAACGTDGLLDALAVRTGLRWGVRRGTSLP